MTQASPSHSSDVIKPVVAGRFYPDQSAELKQEIQRFLEEAEVEPADHPVLAILSPHAGYVFSGPVAGYSFRHVQNQNPDTVLFLALSHQGVEGGAVFSGSGFETPLGFVGADQELAQELLKGGEPLIPAVEPYRTEHSVEVNLPFVQTVFPEARVAAILITHTDPKLCKTIGDRVSRIFHVFPNKKILIVVSSDMSHYPSYETANRIDQQMLDRVATLNPEAIYTDLLRLGHDPHHNVHCVMCGGAAMLAAVETAKALGAQETKILCYRNSGDTSYGETTRVVGYGSLAIYAPRSFSKPDDNSSEPFKEEIEFTPEEKRELLQIARKSIDAILRRESYEPHSHSPGLKVHTGVFVTLKNHGELRGCLGRFDSDDLSLDRLVSVMATQSATHDIRFKPLTLEELPQVDIQISVLTPREKIKDVEEIIIGKHGLQIQGRNAFGVMRSGTLLPQVAIEQNWDLITFLESTCLKAGLETNSWKDPQTEIWKYGAILFGDRDLGIPPYTMNDE